MAGVGERGRLLTALLLSVLAHLLAGGGIPWPVAQPDILPSPPIDARLAPPAAPPPVSGTRPEPRRTAATRPTPIVQPPPARADVATQAEPAQPPTQDAGSEAAPTPQPPAADPEVAPTAVPPAPPAPLHPQLPSGFTVRYLVQGSEGGLVLGRLDHIWQRSAERYSLYALAKATGLIGLIYPGLLSQTSYGEITPTGLKPESYWLQRGSRQLKAHFDWERMRADLGERYPPVDLKPGTQDLLSVIYQLALFSHTQGELWVLDGKSLKHYRLEELGMETLETPLGVVRTRHLRVQAGHGAERIDVWLRDTPPHLPMKIHWQGSRNGSAVLMAEAIRGLGPAADGEAAHAVRTD